jgi:hypothetical protein
MFAEAIDEEDIAAKAMFARFSDRQVYRSSAAPRSEADLGLNGIQLTPVALGEVVHQAGGHLLQTRDPCLHWRTVAERNCELKF